MDWLLVLLGFMLLVAGGEALVRGASGIALAAKVSPAVVGLTIVAAGTSMPELVVSVQSALGGNVGIALGNVVGSNILNIFCILGITSLILPLDVPRTILTRDVWWMLAASALLFPLMWSGMRINRLEGGVLFGGFLVYLAILVQAA